MTVGEKPELSGEFDFPYEEFREGLIPEWQELFDRLSATNRGREFLNDETFREYVAWNSDFMEDQYQKITSGSVELSDYTNGDIGNLYDSISSLIDTKRLYPVLDFVRQGTEREIQELTTNNPHGSVKELLRKRRLASITEELSRVYPVASEAKGFEGQARALNVEVGSSDLDIATSPRKFHAIFAVYDIDSRELSRNARQSIDLLEPFIIEFNDMQSMSYLEAGEAIAEVLTSDIGKEAISGSVGDVLVVNRLRERFVEDDRFPDTEASQGSIRQDNTDLAKLDFIDPETEIKWMIAFDLLLEDANAPRDVFIEVKNLTNGSGYTGRPARYAPLIEVISIRFGGNKRESLEMAQTYCLAKEKVFAGEDLTKEEMDVVESIHAIIDPRIDNVLQKLDSPIETSTNYNHDIGKSPFIRESAPEIASGT